MTYVPPSTVVHPPPNSAGITRIALHMMDQHISQRVLSEMTAIPAPTISQYMNGQRSISRRHLPLLSIALAVHPLQGYAGENECFVVEGEWCDDNPFYYRRSYRSGATGITSNTPARRHSYPHNAAVHKYELL